MDSGRTCPTIISFIQIPYADLAKIAMQCVKMNITTLLIAAVIHYKKCFYVLDFFSTKKWRL